MSDRQLEKRLRVLRDPAPSPELRERLLRDIPAPEAEPAPEAGPAQEAERPVSRVSKARWWDALLPQPVRAPAAALVAIGVIALAAVLLHPVGVGNSLSRILLPVADASGLARAVHVVMNVRTSDREDFDFVDLGAAGMTRVEGWVRWPAGSDDRGRMRLDNGSRTYTFDGITTTYYIKTTNEAWRSGGGRPKLDLLWPAAWLEGILQLQDGSSIVAREEAGGQERLRLHWNAPDLHGRAPAFFDDFEREVELTWDLATKRLTGYTRWVVVDGERRVFSEVASIEYVDQVDEGLFSQVLPADVRWVQLPPASPEIDALPARDAARRFWTAAVAGDWETVRIFCPSPAMVDWLRNARPTELIQLGEPFESGGYPGVYIPYETRFGGPGGPVRKGNLAMRRDNERGRWVYDGGI